MIDKTIEEFLPESLKEISENIGIAATINLIRKYGGVRVYIPINFTITGELVLAVGEVAARDLARIYGGETLSIPRADKAIRTKRNYEICRAYDAGESVRALAKHYKLTERQLYTIMKKTILPKTTPGDGHPDSI